MKMTFHYAAKAIILVTLETRILKRSLKILFFTVSLKLKNIHEAALVLWNYTFIIMDKARVQVVSNE